MKQSLWLGNSAGTGACWSIEHGLGQKRPRNTQQNEVEMEVRLPIPTPLVGMCVCMPFLWFPKDEVHCCRRENIRPYGYILPLSLLGVLPTLAKSFPLLACCSFPHSSFLESGFPEDSQVSRVLGSGAFVFLLIDWFFFFHSAITISNWWGWG